MDVHPPHEPVHTWRDALTHIAIMTVGLFIALMLEGLVEYGQHKHVVREARANIRQELESNHQALQKNIADIDHEVSLSQAGLKTLRFMRAHPNAHGQSITYTGHFADLSDAAWTTARDTGALGFMPYGEVEGDATLYRLQGAVNDQMVRLATRQADVLAPIYAQGENFAKMPESEWNFMLRGAATDMLDLETLKQFMQELDQQYVSTLKTM